MMFSWKHFYNDCIHKSSFIAEEATNFVRGRVEGFQKLNDEAFLHDLEDGDLLDVVNLKHDFVDRVVKFLVVNTSGGSVKLKRGEVIGRVDSVEKITEGGLKISSVCGKKHLDFEGLDIGLQESGEREKLLKILRAYCELIKSASVSHAKSR